MNWECLPPKIEKALPGYELTSDKTRVQLTWLHQHLSQQYWCKGIPKALLKQAIEHSWCLSVFHEKQQVGFARVISDYSTFAYLADVFIAPEHRGKGLARWMIDSFTLCPELPQLQKWLLLTASSQAVYEKSGFRPIAYPDAFMEIRGVSRYQLAD